MQKIGITFVWGISGCGKKTIGRLLANRIEGWFADGDWLLKHMDTRLALSQSMDDPRVVGWFAGKILEQAGMDPGPAVVAFSCFSAEQRRAIRSAFAVPGRFMLLRCPAECASRRLIARQSRMVSLEELERQNALTAEAADSVVVDAEGEPAEVLQRALLMMGIGL